MSSIQAPTQPCTPRVTFNLVVLDIHSVYKHMFDIYFAESEYYRDRDLKQLTEIYDSVVYSNFHEVFIKDYLCDNSKKDVQEWPSFVYSKTSNYDAGIAYKDTTAMVAQCIKQSWDSLNIKVSSYSTIKMMAVGSTLLIGIQHSL